MQVTVTAPGQKRAVRMFQVPKRFWPVVQSIRYKDSPYTARAAFRAPSLCKAILQQMSKGKRRECQALCSKTGPKIILRRRSVSDVKFKWKSVSHELHRRAPMLYRALKAVCIKSRKKIGKGEISKRITTMAAATLLRGRNQCLNMPQTVISTILYRTLFKSVKNVTMIVLCA